MTDRNICVNCIYSYFTYRRNLQSFKWCNYLEWTGEQRPHNGNKCYGFKERGEDDEQDRVGSGEWSHSKPGRT